VILYGRNPVREALRGRRRVFRVWATERAAREPWLRGVPVELASGADIEHRCGAEAHQGLCAEAEGFPYVGERELLEGGRAQSPGPRLLLALDGIQDPQNLGAICRSAEAAGADGVAIPERRAADVTPAACKASAGAVEHLRIARVRNLADFLLAARDRELWCYGAALEGARPYTEVDLSGGVVLVIGAEGAGLRPRVAAACDELVSIPMRGKVESLNASAAAAVLLYAIPRP
jgi:23S rRNA (guanosine2251-2'-O)-methyltransferase